MQFTLFARVARFDRCHLSAARAAAACALFVGATALVGCGNVPSFGKPAAGAAAPAPATAAADTRSAASAPAAATPAPAAPAPAVVAAPAAPPPILPLAQALSDAANALFSNAQLPAMAPGSRLPLVIDPLIDGNSWVQTTTTQQMEGAVLNLVKQQYTQFEPLPFSTSTLARGPIVFIGTFTPLDAAGKIEGPTAFYRICLALLDLRSGKIISKGFARAAPAGVDSTPLPFFQDSPGWSADEATTGYVRTCQGTTAGQPIQPAYWDRIAVAAVVSDAVVAYNSGRYDDALDLYRGALHMPGGSQLRVFNGMYLAAAKLKRSNEASEAFGKLVDFGFKQKRLAVKMLFRPGQALFVANPALTSEYTMWLRQIATHAAAAPDCLVVAGHTSKSGPEPLNQRLSLQRATAVQQRLVATSKPLAKRVKTVGLGSSKAISGTGTDDARDAVDRRVEFQVQECGAS